MMKEEDGVMKFGLRFVPDMNSLNVVTWGLDGELVFR